MADEAVTNEEISSEDGASLKVNGESKEVEAEDSLGDSKDSIEENSEVDVKSDPSKIEDPTDSEHKNSNSDQDTSIDQDEAMDTNGPSTDVFVENEDTPNLKNGGLKRTASFLFDGDDENILACDEPTATDRALEKLFLAIEKLEKEIDNHEHYKGHPPTKKIRNSSPAHSATTDTISSRPSSGMSVRSDSELMNSNEIIGSSNTRTSIGRKSGVDLSNPLFRLPFEHGWRRELVFRANFDQNMRRQADVYYYSPTGKKLRSTREVTEHLGDSNLSVENFSFFKEALGIDDPDKEIIREAKIIKNRTESPQPGVDKSDDVLNVITEGKRTPKPKYPKGVSPEDMPVVKNKAFKVKSVGSRLGSPTASGKQSSTEFSNLSPKTRKLSSGNKSPQDMDMMHELAQSPMNFASDRHSDLYGNDSAYYQTTDPSHHGTDSTKIYSDPASISSLKKYVAPLANPIANSIANSLINHMPLGNQINNQNSAQMMMQMNNHGANQMVGNSSGNQTPNQMTGRDMCPMRCPLANVEPPSLQCSLCLCLYHNQCTGYIPSYNTSFVCKNCHLANSNTPAGASQPQPAHSQGGRSTQKSPSVVAPGASLLHRFPKSSPVMTKPPPQPRLVPVVTQVPVKSKSFNQTGMKLVKNESIPFKSAHKISKSSADLKVGKNNSWTNEKSQANRTAEVDPTIFPQSIAILNGHKFIVVPKPNIVSTSPIANPKQADNAPKIMDTVYNIASNATITPIRQTSKTIDQLKEDKEENKVFQKSLLKSDIFGSQTNVISFDNLSAEYGKYLFKQDPMAAGFPFETQAVKRSISADVIDEPNKRKARAPPVPKLIPKVNKKTENGTPVQKLGRGTKMAIETKNKNYFAEFYKVNQERKYNSLVQIFQYLKMRELASAARVCRMWREIADTPALWKSVRMKNSQVNDWHGLAAALKRHGTIHLDLRKMLLPQEASDDIWDQFTEHIAIVDSLLRIDLCRCPASVVERVCLRMPQLQVLTSTSVRCTEIDPAPFSSLTNLQELRLKGMTSLKLTSDLKCLENLTKLKHLSITSVKDLGNYGCIAVGGLTTLESLELGECTGDVGGANLLRRLTSLTRLRLERCPTANSGIVLLRAAANLPQLQQLELINYDIKPGFEDALGKCLTVKRLLIIPTYVSQSATTNRCVLAAVLRLRNTLTHLMWGVTLELLRVTELFIDQCNRSQADGSQPAAEVKQQPKANKPVHDCIPVLKPVPSLPVEESQNTIVKGRPQVEILPLPALQRLLANELPDTRLKLLRIPFHATWRQTFNDFD